LKGGCSSLIAYAEKMVNDPKNPNGAMAIAYTKCYELRLRSKALDELIRKKVRAVRTVAELRSGTISEFYATSTSLVLMNYLPRNSML
jgi:hypothetical protein